MIINDLYILTWGQFFWIAVLTGIMFLLYKYLLQNLMFSFLSSTSSLKLDERVLFFNRCLVIIAIAVIVFAFLLVNPLAHGIFVSLLVALSFKFISNYIQGTFVIRELKLRQGLALKINEQQAGTIYRLGTTGVNLAQGDTLMHIPYQELINQPVAVLYQAPNYSLFLNCKLPKNMDYEKARQLLLKTIFISPFLAEDRNPFVNRTPEGLEANIPIKKSAYAKNVIQTLARAGFEVEVKRT